MKIAIEYTPITYYVPVRIVELEKLVNELEKQGW